MKVQWIIVVIFTARPHCSQCRALDELEEFRLLVCLSSVRPSVTFRYCVQTNEDTIVRLSAPGRTIPLVSRDKVYPDIRWGWTPAEALKWGTLMSIAKIWPITGALTWKRCNIEGKLVLITNRKSHMGFRLVPKSVTLNDLERRNGRAVCVISPNSLTFATYYVKVV